MDLVFAVIIGNIQDLSPIACAQKMQFLRIGYNELEFTQLQWNIRNGSENKLYCVNECFKTAKLCLSLSIYQQRHNTV